MINCMLISIKPLHCFLKFRDVAKTLHSGVHKTCISEIVQTSTLFSFLLRLDKPQWGELRAVPKYRSQSHFFCVSHIFNEFDFFGRTLNYNIRGTCKHELDRLFVDSGQGCLLQTYGIRNGMQIDKTVTALPFKNNFWRGTGTLVRLKSWACNISSA